VEGDTWEEFENHEHNARLGHEPNHSHAN
jgi:hypothetical protein